MGSLETTHAMPGCPKNVDKAVILNSFTKKCYVYETRPFSSKLTMADGILRNNIKNVGNA